MTRNFKTTQTKLPSVIRDNCGTYSGYNSHKYRKEIICNECRLAVNTYNKEYAQKNKEKIYAKHNARMKERWKTDPIHREKVYAYKSAHKEQVRKTGREYNRRNKKKLQQYEKWYRETFPEKAVERQRRRRAKKYNNGYEYYTTQQVLDLYGTDCHICNKPINLKASSSTSQPGWEQGLHIDHIIPISLGGSDTLQNVRPAHGLCNISKGARMTEDFEPELDPDLFDDHAFDEDDLEDLDDEEYNESEDEEDWEDS